MTKFEQAVMEEVRRIREMLNNCDNVSQFTFTVSASGRVRDGDVEITFGCGNYSASVTANSVDGAVYEHMRRQGWEKTNTPLCLPRVEQAVSTDDGIPF